MFRKVSKALFSLLSLTIIFSSIIPSEVFAQSSKGTEVVKSSEVPLIIEIKNTAYSVDKRLISIDFVVENKSGSFIDNLRYNFEFYNGDKLEKDGLLFRNLDYILSTTDSFEKMAPKEIRRQTIKYEMPETIPGGNYFIRGTVYNEELSFYGINYTKDPIKLTGRGSFILNKVGALIDVENKKAYRLNEGPTLEKDKTYLVAFPKNANEELFNAIKEEKIYSDLKITPVSDGDKIVYEEKDILLEDLINPEEGKGIEFKIKPWENIKSGPHTAFISFKNAKGEQISESSLVRLLYEGLIGRIYKVDTNINSYRKGEKLGLVVNTVIAGDADARKAYLKAILKSSGETVQEFEKEINLNPTFEGTDINVDFTDEKIKSKVVIDEIELILTDEKENILDTQVIKLDPSKIFEYPKSSNWIKNLLLSLLGLIVVVVVLAFVKKKTNLTVVSIAITFALIGGTILSTNSSLVFAQYGGYCMDSSASNYMQQGDCTYDYNTPSYCTDPSASNYGQQEDCAYNTNSSYCMDSSASNYGQPASCTYDTDPYTPPVSGCMDSSANNYNASATVSDGNCTYDNTPSYCQDTSASNYGQLGDCTYDNTPSLCTDLSASNVGSPGPCTYDDTPSYCTDTMASNYMQQGPCTYDNTPSYCTDSSASNYMQLGDCIYNVPGCMDFTASNFNPAATIDNGTCNYSQTGCMNPNADNFDEGATIDDGSCEIGGCMDWTKINYNPEATYNNGTCGGRALSRTFLNIWTVPDGLPVGDQGICVEDCQPVEFYVKLQCKTCLNGNSEAINVNYINNLNGGGSGEHDKSWSFGVEGGDGVDVEFNAYTVVEEDILEKQSQNLAFSNELKKAKKSNLAGTPIYANDIINEWIFGPFLADFCFENFDAEGNVEPTGNSNGIYNQSYQINVNPNFTAGFCQADPGTNTLTRPMSCSLPGEVRASFFLDNDEDGTKDSDEIFVKSSDASSSCIGENGAPLGLIQDIDGENIFSGLSPENCADDNIPYFFKNLLVPGNYKAALDTADAFGWAQTGVQYFINSIWTSAGFAALTSEGITKARVGLKNINPVAISCRANPKTTTTFPIDVIWNINNFYSDQYSLDELTFVWNGVGTLPNNAERSGANANGVYNINYNDSTGGARNYGMNVYAKNNEGEIVSNTASCAVQITPMVASCSAYNSLSANAPQTFFNPGEEVFWKSSVQNGVGSLSYLWTGGGVTGNENQNAGPVQYDTKGQLQTVNVRATASNGVSKTASCSIFVRECLVDDECYDGKYCSPSTFTCVLPPPLFVSPLTLNPGITNKGGKCGLSWTVTDADSCILYKNNQPIDFEGGADTSIGDILVDPGTYSMLCENETGLSVTGGPVKCLVNPDIREQ